MKLGKAGGLTLIIRPSAYLALALAVWLDCLGAWLTISLILAAHEAAHTLAARLAGCRVESLEWSALGGRAHLTCVQRLSPGREALIAAAGPAANVLLLMAALTAAHFFPTLANGGQVGDFVIKNLMLGGINLLPAMPLDGGRMLRAALCAMCGPARASRVAAWVGFALSAGLLGLFIWAGLEGVWNFLLLFLAVFTAAGALREAREAPYQLMREAAAKQAILSGGHTLPVRQIAASADAMLGDVVRRFSPGKYHQVTVMDAQGRCRCIADEGRLLEALVRAGPQARLGDAL